MKKNKKVFSIEEGIDKYLSYLAELNNCSKSDIIEMALEDFFSHNDESMDFFGEYEMNEYGDLTGYTFIYKMFNRLCKLNQESASYLRVKFMSEYIKNNIDKLPLK